MLFFYSLLAGGTASTRRTKVSDRALFSYWNWRLEGLTLPWIYESMSIRKDENEKGIEGGEKQALLAS